MWTLISRVGEAPGIEAPLWPQTPGYHDLTGDAFRKLGNDVAHVKISALKRQMLSPIDQAAGTKGLIIDLREYPIRSCKIRLGATPGDGADAVRAFYQRGSEQSWTIPVGERDVADAARAAPCRQDGNPGG